MVNESLSIETLNHRIKHKSSNNVFEPTATIVEKASDQKIKIQDELSLPKIQVEQVDSI